MINLLISKNRFEIIDPVKTPSEAAKNMDLTISYDYNTAGFSWTSRDQINIYKYIEI